ncbi:MAG: hypothetical protein CMJ58_19780 [Planctomycetaceae bacterium]|nr:hypothetical protein [Planctomycetaceae bacterium]
MTDKAQYTTGGSLLVSAAAFVVVVAGLRAAQEIVVPFILAAFLALISLPALNWFQRRGLPGWAAVLAMTAIVVVAGFFLVGVVGASVNKLSQQLPEYQQRLTALQINLSNWLKARGIAPEFGMGDEIFNAERGMSLLGGVLGSIGRLANNFLLVVLILVFMQLEAADLPAKLRAIYPADSDVVDRLDRIKASVWQYARLKTRISFITAAFVVVWLWLLGVDFPVLWGLLAFLLNFVPNIGSVIAAVPAVVVAILQPAHGGVPPTMAESLVLGGWTAFGYLFVNLVIGNVVEPRMMGSGVGISTLFVFLSLVFWGWVLGPVGMVLSVPLTMVVKIALENSEDLKWVAILLGPGTPPEPRPVAGDEAPRG